MKTIRTKAFFATTVIVLSMLLLFACQKTNSNIESPPPPATVTASVAGIVTDLNNVPVNNAIVAAGTSNTTTDINGKFILKNVQLDADGGFAKVSKDGFFDGSRTFSVNKVAVNYIKIQLIPKTVSGTFAASSGGNVNIPGGGSVNFSTGFINASTGNAYTGNISVSSFYLNPSDQNFSQYMPGDLKGINTASKEGVLQSFGMVLVEMDDGSGNKLQLASGKTATITLPIAAALQASAPATVSLWYFDDTKGVWKEEGTGTKQGNNYVGDVKHFSFWNAGQLSQAVNLTATFKDSAGTAFANKLVTISRPDSTTTNAYTDNAGKVSGLVPVNETLTMKVYSDCGTLAYDQHIGPFNVDTDLGAISVIVNCNQTFPDTTQYIKLTLGGNNYSWGNSSITESRADSSSYFTISIIGGGSNNTSDSSTYFLGGIYNDNAASGPGNYPFNLYTIINGNVAYNTYNTNNANNHLVSTITKFDAVGGYIEGGVSGWIKNFPVATTDSFAFSCTYRVKRIQ